MPVKVKNHPDHLSMRWKSGKSQIFSYIWLRDHCRCAKCYNTKTHQIQFDVNKLPVDIKPAVIEYGQDLSTMVITWEDEHITKYSLKWLEDLEFPKKSKLLRELWDKTSVANLHDSKISSDKLLNSDGVRALLSSLVKYGFALVTDVHPTIDATEDVIKRVFPVQRTYFGEMWSVTDDYVHEDMAYSNNFLASHTDNTYFVDPAGLQIFHMLRHDGTGGETVLVDGFKAAETVRVQNRGAFDILSQSPIECEYIETDGTHFSATDPVIKLHPVTKNLYSIRYNIYDRALLNSIPQEQIPQFYGAFQLFGKEIQKSENEWWLKLQPGTILLFDNWRVLHGRAAYTGKRNLCGCYVSRTDWINKAKGLGIDTE